MSALNSTLVLNCEVHESCSIVATGWGKNGGLGATGRHPSCSVLRKMGGGENEDLKRLGVEIDGKTCVQRNRAQGTKKEVAK